MSLYRHLVLVRIVYLDGRRLPPALESALCSVRVFDRLNGISHCVMGFDRPELKPEIRRPWASSAGFLFPWATRMRKNRVLRGITGNRLRLSGYDVYGFSAAASNPLQRLGHSRKNRRFERPLWSY
ncbi:MAG: hypothetical protein LBD37_04935 [Treponema sp.]|jgi:hypothetical protein|nr:hypothetical protein [Treponema sp.]